MHGSVQCNVLRARLEAIVDVHSEVGRNDPTLECDAISMGVGFTGFRLDPELGEVRAVQAGRDATRA